MALDIKCSFIGNPTDTDVTMMIKVPASDVVTRQIEWELIHEIVRQVATKYVEENYQKLASLLDQQAIANLAIADAGKKIAEEIRSKPTVLHDKEVRTEVYQRGIFGGMRKL